MFFSFCWSKTISCSFLADRFGQETSSEMVFLQRYGLTVPASRAPSRAGWTERLQHHGQRPRPGRRQERARRDCSWSSFVRQRNANWLCWPGRVFLCLSRGGWDEPWRKHRTAEHAGKLALPGGTCVMGKRYAWDMARPEEMELRGIQVGKCSSKAWGIWHHNLDSNPVKVLNLSLCRCHSTRVIGSRNSLSNFKRSVQCS